jgi:hypothetical protein
MIEGRPKTEASLRDFVYLDWERVRSLSAQLLRGVPQDATRESGHDLGAKGEVRGGIRAVLTGKGEGDYRYFRTQNETRSLHHYVYTLFETRLRERGAVTEVDAHFDFDRWTEDGFRDGQFVRVTGLVRLMDYAWISIMMEALPGMMRAAQHAATIGLKQDRDEGRITQNRGLFSGLIRGVSRPARGLEGPNLPLSAPSGVQLLHLRASWNSPSRSCRTVHATADETDFSIKATLSITSVRPLNVSLAEIGCLQILARLLLPIGPWGWLATMNA